MPARRSTKTKDTDRVIQDIDTVLASINKEYGDGTLVRGRELKGQLIPRVLTGSLSLDVALGGGWPANQWSEIVGHECLAPGTRVLTADLRWEAIENLSVGDELIGFDEQHGGFGRGRTSKFQPSFVTHLGRKVLPAYEIETQYGITVASAGHLWLVNDGTHRKWVRTDALQEGVSVAAVGPMWSTMDSWVGGYLAGFYDGEGTISLGWGTSNGARLVVNQAIGETADFFEKTLLEAGFPHHKTFAKRLNPRWQDQWKFLLAGRYEDMRLVGSVRPRRMLEKSRLLWEGVSTKQVHGCAAVVSSVKSVGRREVVTIGTSTKTLIADGMLSHNSMGKSTVAFKTAAFNQKINPEYEVLWVAAEEFVAPWAESLGCDLDRFTIVENNYMEQVYEIVIKVLDARAVDMVVIDSLPMLVPMGEYEKSMEEFTVGLAARLTGSFFRKVGKATKRSLVEDERPVLGLMVNQWREKIGVVYGDPRTTPGGRGKNFAYFTRVELSRDSWIEDSRKRRVGQTIKANVFKNKTAPGQRTGTVDFYFDACPPHTAGDYDTGKEYVSVAMELGIISRGGKFYRIDGWDERYEGRETLFEVIADSEELQHHIQERVLAEVNPSSLLHDEEPERRVVKRGQNGASTGAPRRSTVRRPNQSRVR